MQYPTGHVFEWKGRISALLGIAVLCCLASQPAVAFDEEEDDGCDGQSGNYAPCHCWSPGANPIGSLGVWVQINAGTDSCYWYFFPYGDPPPDPDPDPEPNLNCCEVIETTESIDCLPGSFANCLNAGGCSVVTFSVGCNLEEDCDETCDLSESEKVIGRAWDCSKFSTPQGGNDCGCWKIPERLIGHITARVHECNPPQ